MNISGHAFLRMLERGFTAEMLAEFLAGDFCSLESKTSASAVLLINEIEGKFWTLVVNTQTDNLITVRRSHKEEVAYYESRRH